MIDTAIRLIKTDPENWAWIENYLFMYRPVKIKDLGNGGSEWKYDFYFEFGLDSIGFSMFPKHLLGWWDRRKLRKAIEWWVSNRIHSKISTALRQQLEKLEAEEHVSQALALRTVK